MQSQFICFVNSIKLNLNLVTKLKLLSTVNITNIDITLYLVKKLQVEYLKQIELL